MKDNPIAILAAALQTARPELLTLFEAAARRRIDDSPAAAAEIAEGLTAAVKALFSEVYDMRRANDAMNLSVRHMVDLMRGLDIHTDTHRQIHHLARSGQLPVEGCIEEVERTVRDSVKAEQLDDGFRRNH